MSTTISHRVSVAHAQALRAALKKLRVWESMWIDLSYAAGDQRGVIPDSEQDPAWITERDSLAMQVTYYAARCDGHEHTEASLYADTPLSTENPYRAELARVAVTLHWRIPQWALDWARRRLERPMLDIDSFQAAVEGGL